jgi:hypothetical protein
MKRLLASVVCRDTSSESSSRKRRNRLTEREQVWLNLGVAPSKEVRHGDKVANSNKEIRRESQVERKEERVRKLKKERKKERRECRNLSKSRYKS